MPLPMGVLLVQPLVLLMQMCPLFLLYPMFPQFLMRVLILLLLDLGCCLICRAILRWSI